MQKRNSMVSVFYDTGVILAMTGFDFKNKCA